jgi:hypothetical protein
VNKKERRRQAGGTPTRRETLGVEALLADLDRARKCSTRPSDAHARISFVAA